MRPSVASFDPGRHVNDKASHSKNDSAEARSSDANCLRAKDCHSLVPIEMSAKDLCTAELLVATQDDDLMSTLDRMRAAGVRRIPVVDADGVLQGLLAVDDLLCVVGEITSSLTQLVAREVNVEVHKRP